MTTRPSCTSSDPNSRRSAALAALASYLQDNGLLPVDALLEAAGRHKHGDKMIAIIEKATGLETATASG